VISSRVVSDQAEALFASDLQPSSGPTQADIHVAIRQALQRLGRRGCVARVAQEFGDHPIEAVARMAWVLNELDTPRRIGDNSRLSSYRTNADRPIHHSASGPTDRLRLTAAK
jgi:hypothetical protein